jgi:transposase
MKQHIAIDLGSCKSQICVRSEKGDIVEEKKIRTQDLGRYLQKQPVSRVIMETCSESWAVGDAASVLGHEVRIVPGTLVRTLGVGQRGIKTDQRDAQVLSEVSTRIDLPSVHIKSSNAREIQTQLRMRHQLVTCRSKLIFNVKGWLRTQAIRTSTGAVATFTKRVRKKVESLPSYVVRQLDQIDGLHQQIMQATKELEEQACKMDIVQRLRSIPGIGVITGLSFVSTIDTIERFADAHRLQSYLGLTPGEKSSSLTTRRTSITKAGSSRLRSLLVESSWTLYRNRPNDPLIVWAKAIEKRRGRKIAIIALARKLAGVCYYVWKNNTMYNP